MTKQETTTIAYQIILQELKQEHITQSILSGDYASFSSTISYTGYKEASQIATAYQDIIEKLEKSMDKLKANAPDHKRREQARGYYNRLLKKAKKPFTWYERGHETNAKGEIMLVVEKCDQDKLKQLKNDVQFAPVYDKAVLEFGESEYFFDSFKDLIHEEFRITGWYDIDTEE